MNLEFYKYQGAGNDFIIVDNRHKNIELSKEQINRLCDRRFGIGADGLMYLKAGIEYDFSMVYFNSDGSESTMCGNGGRCIVQFAHDLNLINDCTKFLAIDGVHEAQVLNDNIVALGMVDVEDISSDHNGIILNTGSPHLVIEVNDLEKMDVKQVGCKIRNQTQYGEKGINVNFVQKKNGQYFIRTYERGVEDETLACGTGVTAAAIATSNNQIGQFEMHWHAMGGILNVTFQKISPTKAIKVILTGPAQKVFEGSIEI